MNNSLANQSSAKRATSSSRRKEGGISRGSSGNAKKRQPSDSKKIHARNNITNIFQNIKIVHMEDQSKRSNHISQGSIHASQQFGCDDMHQEIQDPVFQQNISTNMPKCNLAENPPGTRKKGIKKETTEQSGSTPQKVPQKKNEKPPTDGGKAPKSFVAMQFGSGGKGSSKESSKHQSEGSAEKKNEEKQKKLMAKIEHIKEADESQELSSCQSKNFRLRAVADASKAEASKPEPSIKASDHSQSSLASKKAIQKPPPHAKVRNVFQTTDLKHAACVYLFDVGRSPKQLIQFWLQQFLFLQYQPYISKQMSAAPKNPPPPEAAPLPPSSTFQDVPRGIVLEERLKIIEEYTNFSILYGSIFLVVLLYQVTMFVLEVDSQAMSVSLPEHQRDHMANFVHCFFLTLTFVGLNYLLKSLFEEDRKRQKAKSRDQSRDPSQDLFRLKPSVEVASQDAGSQDESTLRKYFDLLILGVFSVYTVWITECLMRLIGDVLVVQSKLIIILLSSITIHQSQRLLLEFVDFDMHSEKVKKYTRLDLQEYQFAIKRGIMLLASLYFVFRLLTQFMVDTEAQVHKQLLANPLFSAEESITVERVIVRYLEKQKVLSCLSACNLSALLPVFYGNVKLTYFSLKYSYVVKRMQQRDCQEANSHERIWHKALAQDVSDSIALYNPHARSLYINQQLELLLADCQKQVLSAISSTSSQQGSALSKAKTSMILKTPPPKERDPTLVSKSTLCLKYLKPFSEMRQNGESTSENVVLQQNEILSVNLSQIRLKVKKLDKDDSSAGSKKLAASEKTSGANSSFALNASQINGFKLGDNRELDSSELLPPSEFDRSSLEILKKTIEAKGDEPSKKQPLDNDGGGGSTDLLPSSNIFKFEDVLHTLMIFAMEEKSRGSSDNRKSSQSQVYFKIIDTNVYIKITPRVVVVEGKPQVVFSITNMNAWHECRKLRESKKKDLLQLASIVHDLKTPLNCIQLTSCIIKESIDDKPELQQYMRNFNISFEFIFSMIEDIQDLAKFNNNQKFNIECDYFNLREFVGDVIVLFEEQSKFKNVNLKQEIDMEVPTTVYTDQKRIKQVLMNMISNALKFTNDGSITVRFGIEDYSPPRGDNQSTRRSTVSRRMQIMNGETEEDLRAKRKLKIEVEDTGIGISEKDLTKLFKYFGKLQDKQKMNKKGTGLGLNISRRIIESMGGEIKVESKVGKGTKFSMFVVIQIQNPASSAGDMSNGDMLSDLPDVGRRGKLGSSKQQRLKNLTQNAYQSMMQISRNLLAGGFFAGNSTLDFQESTNRSVVTTKREAAILANQVDKLVDKKSSQKSSYLGLTEHNSVRRTSPAKIVEVNESIISSKCDVSALTNELHESKLETQAASQQIDGDQLRVPPGSSKSKSRAHSPALASKFQIKRMEDKKKVSSGMLLSDLMRKNTNFDRAVTVTKTLDIGSIQNVMNTTRVSSRALDAPERSSLQKRFSKQLPKIEKNLLTE